MQYDRNIKEALDSSIIYVCMIRRQRQTKSKVINRTGPWSTTNSKEPACLETGRSHFTYMYCIQTVRTIGSQDFKKRTKVKIECSGSLGCRRSTVKIS